jgi:hypothetical protein
MAAPIAAGMLMQTLYYLVDLYFVGRLGDAALAGVGVAGNVMMIVIALTQVLGVGTVALIAQAVGRRDAADANHVFNQSLSIACVLGALTLAGGYALTDVYLGTIAADEPTIAAGRSYLFWFLPGMALQFAMVAMSSALRGTGIVKPTMIVQMATVLLNVALAPVLIAGVGTGRALGVAGAGLASTLSVAAGVLLLFFYPLEKYVAVDPPMDATGDLAADAALGLPAGGGHADVRVRRDHLLGDTGLRRRRAGRVRRRPARDASHHAAGARALLRGAGGRRSEHGGEAVRSGSGDVPRGGDHERRFDGPADAALSAAPGLAGGGFTDDRRCRGRSRFLRVISLNFVAAGLIFVCSGMFQALGNTLPALASSAGRLLTFVVPAVGLAGWPALRIEHVWYLSVASVALQVVTSLLLLRHALAGVSAEVPAHADAVSRDVVAELAFGKGGELVGEEPARRGAE